MSYHIRYGMTCVSPRPLTEVVKSLPGVSARDTARLSQAVQTLVEDIKRQGDGEVQQFASQRQTKSCSAAATQERAHRMMALEGTGLEAVKVKEDKARRMFATDPGSALHAFAGDTDLYNGEAGCVFRLC